MSNRSTRSRVTGRKPQANRKRFRLVPRGSLGMAALVLGLIGAGSGATVVGMQLASSENPSAHDGSAPVAAAGDVPADPGSPEGTPGPPGDQRAAVGQGKTLGGLVAQVNSASLQRDIGGVPYVVVSVTLTNQSARSQRVSPLVWWLEGPNGRTHQAGPNDRPDALEPGRLATGESVTGTLVFEAPPGAYRVAFAPPGAGDRARVVWEVSV